MRFLLPRVACQFLLIAVLILVVIVSLRLAPPQEMPSSSHQSSLPRVETVPSAEPVPPPSPPPPTPPSTGQPMSPSRLSGVRSWVSYYHSGSIADLRRFDLIVIDAEAGAGNYTEEGIATLKAGGKVVISYLNIGALETFRSYWEDGQSYRLDVYEGWPDEYWVDTSKVGWHDLMVAEAKKLLDKGVDGFYLDNLDVAQRYSQRTEVRRGVVRLIERLRRAYPQAVIVLQNGLFLRDDRGSDGKRLTDYADGWAQEEVFTTYEDGYRRVSQQQTEELILALSDVRRRGLVVFCLDYAQTDDLRQYARARATEIGCLSYVATKELDRVIIQ